MSTSPSQLPYFDRAWQIQLVTQAGPTLILSSDQFSSPLRATFKITTRALLAYWQADITIFNLNQTTFGQLMQTGAPASQIAKFMSQLQANQPIVLGDLMTVSAGYKYSLSGAFNPASNVIWDGPVFQPIWTRVNVVDFTLTLRCMVGLLQDALNCANIAVGAGASAYDVISRISQTCGIPPESQTSIDQSTLSKTIYPRAQTIFGRPYDYIRRFAKDNNLQSWVSPRGLNVRSLKVNANTVPDYTYAPLNLGGQATQNGTHAGIVKYTLLGTPEQTQEGVIFKVLLDSQPQIGNVVQLAPGTAINRLPYQIGQFPGILDQNGLYIVTGINHFGDTRGHGDDWYTEITAVTNNFFPDFLNPTTPTTTN